MNFSVQETFSRNEWHELQNQENRNKRDHIGDLYIQEVLKSTFFPGGKARPGRDSDHSLPSRAEIVNE
jgi:hypothetical protein